VDAQPPQRKVRGKHTRKIHTLDNNEIIHGINKKYVRQELANTSPPSFHSVLLFSPKEELIVVMLIGPVVMNGLQFWLNDNMLKSKRKRGYVQLEEATMGQEGSFLRYPQGL
jgi:hypothetical protein